MMALKKAMKIFSLIGLIWLIMTGSMDANPVRKTIDVDGFEREYLVYLPANDFQEQAEGILICLHGFGRTMNDFFGEYNISSVADSLNLIIVAPQALEEQDEQVILEAALVSSITENLISLHAVWGCGLRVRATLLVFGTQLLNVVLNKDVDDVNFIDRMIDNVLSDYALPTNNVFILGTSMGGFMAYQYALKKGERLSGLISIAGSMGLDIQGMDEGTKIPICDFHSVTDEVVPYTGSQILYLASVAMAKPKVDVINYWVKNNAAGKPVTEQVKYYPSTNGITVEKKTYPEAENEVIHYQIDGAKHSYFFKKEAGDCMDHVEEIAKFIDAHRTASTPNRPIFTEQKRLFYPNPVHDRIEINVVVGIISIYDLAGRKVLTKSFTDGTVYLSSLKSGLYFIEIRSGETIYTGKLIKR